MPRKKRPDKPGKPREKRGGRPRGTYSKGGNSNDSNSTPQTFKLKLNAMAHGGYALGKHKGRVVFVPYAIPGETIEATRTERRKTVDFASGVKLLQASADRVYPQCPHFGPGQCWGCQWQHIDYQAQLLLKQDVLTDQLARIGKFKDITLERAVQRVVPSPQQWHYNFNMTLERGADGKLGFYRIDGRSVEAIEECHVLHRDLEALFQLIEIDYEDMQRLSLFRGSDGETMLVIDMNSEKAPELHADLPTSVNVVLPDNEPVNLLGDTAIYYEVKNRLFRMTAGGTFRGNVRQIDNLVTAVLNMLNLTEDDAVLDLYAGVGVFSGFMAEQAGLVTLVESYPPMVTDADENLQEFDNIDIIEGNVEDVLEILVDAGDIYEAALLDPPGSGVSEQALKSLMMLNIPRLVYISSDPATLARDAKKLVNIAGYEMHRVQPFDFAPQTYYIDAAVLFEK
jgi:23S rRNA (uracil1939-C5)-methyltransferase